MLNESDPKAAATAHDSRLKRLQRWLIQALLPIPFIFVGYWAANKLAAVFEINTYVSAAYLPASVTFAAAMMFGVAYLPVMYLAVLTMAVLIYGLPFAGFGYLDPLREVLVFGAAGLALRPIWQRPARRVTLSSATLFLILALIASTVSALLIPHIPQVRELLGDRRDMVAFLGGDFAGVVMGVPAILMLREIGMKLLRRGRAVLTWPTMRRDLIYVLAAGGAALVAAWIPVTLDVQSQSMALLMFLPIVLAGLSSGVRVGFVVACVSCLAYLYASVHWGAYPIQPIEIQMILAVSIAVSLLSGAAHDDRLFNAERADYDPLTGVVNRRQLEAQIDQACRRAKHTRGARRFAILCLHLDRSAEALSSLGGAALDEILFEIGFRLRQCGDGSETIAYLGHHEFALLLPGVGDRESLMSIAAEILRALEQPIVLESGDLVSVEAGAGMAIYPHDGEAFLALARRARCAIVGGDARRLAPARDA